MKFIIFIYLADPAGPLFSLQNRNNRLASTDAEYVEVIHTNGGATGIGFPIGHAGFLIIPNHQLIVNSIYF